MTYVFRILRLDRDKRPETVFQDVTTKDVETWIMEHMRRELGVLSYAYETRKD